MYDRWTISLVSEKEDFADKQIANNEVTYLTLKQKLDRTKSIKGKSGESSNLAQRHEVKWTTTALNIRIRKQNSLTTESGRLEVSKAGLEKNWKGYQALQGTRKTKIFSQRQLACKKFRATDREFANRKTIRTNAFAECHKQPMKLRFSYVNFRAKTSYGNECHLTINTKGHWQKIRNASLLYGV